MANRAARCVFPPRELRAPLQHVPCLELRANGLISRRPNEACSACHALFLRVIMLKCCMQLSPSNSRAACKRAMSPYCQHYTPHLTAPQHHLYSHCCNIVIMLDSRRAFAGIPWSFEKARGDAPAVHGHRSGSRLVSDTSCRADVSFQ